MISQLKPQKYEKIMEFPGETIGTWIPTDEEWENVKEDYKYGEVIWFHRPGCYVRSQNSAF